MEFARQQPRHGILVDAERVPQAVEIALRHAQPRIDLLAAIVARIAEREEPVGADFRVAEAYAALADVHVLVLDDDARAAGAPGRVEGAQVLTAEQPLDARPAERAGHHPVERAAAAERHRSGRRSEIAHDAGEQLIALLPVAAR